MKHWLPLVFGFGLLAGCGAPHVKDPLEAGEIASGATIGLLPINFLERPAADIKKNAVRFAGSIGQLAAAKGKDTKRRKFSEALLAQDYRYQQQVNESLARRLANAGLTATPLEFSRSIDNVLGEVPPRRFEKRYPDSPASDLLLDIYVDFVGYSAEKLGEPYLPTFHIGARLVDTRSKTTVYESLIHYRSFDVEGEQSTIEPDPQYTFEDFDALLAEPGKAKRGLELAIDAVIDRLVEELSPAAA